MPAAPLFSIITVVLNRENDIAYTLESVENQEFRDFEYIVIDGKSTDATPGVLEKHSGTISQLISEPDKGIYDAMNKGLQLARGEYVLFLNGGDSLHSPAVLEQIAQKIALQNHPDILYGECMFVDKQRNPKGVRSEVRKNPLPESLNADSFKFGSNVTHQCFVVKRTLCPLYDLNYRLSSDIDWMLKCVQKAKDTVNLQMIVADFVLGDATQQQYWRSMKERFVIMAHHYGWAQAVLSHAYMLLIRPLRIN